jgi:hypothetical protein
MRKTRTLMITTAGAALALTVSGTTPASAGGGHDHGHHDTGRVHTVFDGLNGPRGLDALGHGLSLVTEIDGTFSLVVEHHRHHHRGPSPDARIVRLGHLDTTFSPAIAAGRHGTVWLLTGGDDDSTTADDATSARLFKWRHGWDAPVEVANIGAYQQTDPDPYNLADDPGESNPFGLAALRDGSVLVSDAAANDLLHVSRSGKQIETVARLKPRMVTTPAGLPGAGSVVAAEAVATSVTVGKDGAWYIGELRGYPATPGTSEIWRVEPGTTDAICDPEHPWGSCKRYADGLTSIVDLGAGVRGIYAVTLSKMSWLAIESENPPPGAEIGGLFLVSRGHHHGYGRHGGGSSHGARITELVPGQLTLPAGVDVADVPYVVGPIFPPGGQLMRIE